MDNKGKILEETSYENTVKDITKFIKDIKIRFGKCQAVCESTANMWLKTYKVFEKHKIPIKLANPYKTKAIAQARIKTDKLDARTLAYLVRTDLVTECYIISKKSRNNRALRHRIRLVEDKTRIKNRVHNILDKYDLTLIQRDMFGIRTMLWLKEQKFDNGNDRQIILQCIRQIKYLNDEIIQVEKSIKQQDIMIMQN